MSERHLSEISPSGNRIVGSHVFILLIFLIFIFSVPTFGQQISAYSDSWADDDGTIYSCGVTADSANSYGHTYWTSTTLTSPSGRTSSGWSSQDNSYNAYTRVETSLPWDWNDLGDYSEQSQHSFYCPTYGRTMSFYMGAGGKAGYSQASYTFESGGLLCTYHIIPDCYVRCGPTYIYRGTETACPSCSIRIQYWYETSSGSIYCLPLNVTYVDSPAGCPPCYNYP